MIVQCDKCQTKYRLDDARVTGGGVKVRCTKCMNVFIVRQIPIEEARIEEVLTTQDDADRGVFKEAAAQSEPMSGQRKKERPDKNLSLDFDSGEASVARRPADPPSFSFDDIDFGEGDQKREIKDSSSADLAAQKNEASGNSADKEGLFDGIDFGLDEKPAGQEQGPGQAGTEKNGPAVFNKTTPSMSAEAYAKTPVAEAGLPGEDTAGLPSEKTPPSRPQTAKGPSLEDDRGLNFSELLSKEVQADSSDAPKGVESVEYRGQRSGPSLAGPIIALIVFLFGIGSLYLTEAPKVFYEKFFKPAPAAEDLLSIESLNGYFAENRDAGRVFVIEAKVKNLSSEPTGIKGARGVIYNSKGQVEVSRITSPGRVVSVDDIKNSTAEDLLRQFRDPTPIVVPGKATMPVMSIFTVMPPDAVEFGIDIMR
ncbi:MAG: zinc-ribbon domain-containing protein [Deltaproteobacteria bacterium]